MGVQLSWQVWWSGCWAQGPGTPREGWVTLHQGCRIAQWPISSAVRMGNTKVCWVQAGGGEREGMGLLGAVLRKNPVLLLAFPHPCSPLPLSLWVPGWAPEPPPALLT